MATLLSCSFLFLAGCAGGDSDDGWQCFAHSDTGVCDCFINIDVKYGGNTVAKVEECTSYARCFWYLGKTFEEPVCSCGAEDFMPEAGSKDVREVSTCPEDE